MGYSMDDTVDTDFPFLHMAFDSTFVGPLDKLVTVHLCDMVEVETVVVGKVVAAVGPYTVAGDTVMLEIDVLSSKTGNIESCTGTRSTTNITNFC